jgi:hypothetical protein
LAGSIVKNTRRNGGEQLLYLFDELAVLAPVINKLIDNGVDMGEFIVFDP